MLCETCADLGYDIRGYIYIHGYFKLDKSRKTLLDLTTFGPPDGVKWLYFTAFHEFNPQRRAWFNTICGPAFGESQCDSKSSGGSLQCYLE